MLMLIFFKMNYYNG